MQKRKKREISEGVGMLDKSRKDGGREEEEGMKHVRRGQEGGEQRNK